jgi:hypothetical protein
MSESSTGLETVPGSKPVPWKKKSFDASVKNQPRSPKSIHTFGIWYSLMPFTAQVYWEHILRSAEAMDKACRSKLSSHGHSDGSSRQRPCLYGICLITSDLYREKCLDTRRWHEAMELGPTTGAWTTESKRPRTFGMSICVLILAFGSPTKQSHISCDWGVTPSTI